MFVFIYYNCFKQFDLFLILFFLIVGMEEIDAAQNLEQLESYFRTNFGTTNLSFEICRSSLNEESYLRISNPLVSRELNYLPSFYIVGETDFN